ncbi:MAG: SDR family NAD(P)-dependent oxidoreductase [bacterium]|nr:SDR family NAD(P)-dependent oxidoreductase [bacterium]
MNARGDNRVAIVTGARPWGVGGATARALAQRGYDVALVDLRQDWGEQSAEAISEQTGQRAIWVRADVSNRDDVVEMANSVLGEFGRIDALVNNAAIGGASSTEDFEVEEFNRTIGVNLLGPMLCTQAVIPAMKEAGYGRIVSVASTAPFNPPPADMSPVSLYNAAKGGLIAWTKSAAAELAPYGIVVNVVALGGISTGGMGSENPPTQEQDEHMLNVVHRGLLPWGRLLGVDEAADVIAYAASAPSHAMLGATIHASGGRVMPL